MKSSALPGLMAPLVLVGALLSTVTPTSASRIGPRRAFGTACSDCGGRATYRIDWYLSRSPISSPSSSLGLSSPTPSSAGPSSTSPPSPYPSSSGLSSASPSSYPSSFGASSTIPSSASPPSSYPSSSGPASTSSSFVGSSSTRLADPSSPYPSPSYPFSSGPSSPSPSSSLPPFFHEYPLPPSPSESPSARVPSGWFLSDREQKDALRTEAILLRGQQELERIYLGTQV